jgi:cell division transport system permease protein
MNMMIRTFFRHWVESLKSLKRNGWMTFASVTAVAITLTLAGVFLAVIFNATKLASDIEKNVEVTVFVDMGTNKSDRKALENNLEDLDHVKKVTFSSQEQELKKIQKAMGNAWSLFEGDSNPLYDVYIVKASDAKYVKQVSKDAAKLTNVFKADYGGTSSDKIFKFANAIKTWGLAGAVLLIFVAVLLISNTIRITIMSRQQEIQIMRLVGAKNGYIRWPFFIEGGWIGLIGAIVPILIMTFGYKTVYNLANPYLLQSHLSFMQPQDFIWKIDVSIGVGGFVIGAFGSILSMRRFLKI